MGKVGIARRTLLQAAGAVVVGALAGARANVDETVPKSSGMLKGAAMEEYRMKQYAEAAQRAARWIVSEQCPDGSFTPPEMGVDAYFKVAYTLGVTGHPVAASRLLDWIKKNNFTADGDFRGTSKKGQIPIHTQYPLYSNSWVIQGAHRVGRFDVSMRGMSFVLKHQDPSGGFYCNENGNRAVDMLSTAACGTDCIYTGYLDEAKKAASCLERMWSLQPDPQKVFYKMTLDEKLITDFPKSAALDYVVDAAKPEQIYWQPGWALIFLMQLYRATEDAHYLKLAQRIFDFSKICQDDVYTLTGKLPYGSALLYHAAGDKAARTAAVKFCDHLLASQQPEGSWILPKLAPYAHLDRAGRSIKLSVTAEFTVWLCEIPSALASRG